MSNLECISCRRRKASAQCEVCQADLCKDCTEFLEESAFSFLTEVPDLLRHTRYCPGCWAANVEPEKTRYSDLMEIAREAYFFFLTQRAFVPVTSRAKEKVSVEACADREETVLRLAFMAAQQGHNAVIEAEVICQKVRNEGYQKSLWKGVGVPATVDVERLERRTRRH